MKAKSAKKEMAGMNRQMISGSGRFMSCSRLTVSRTEDTVETSATPTKTKDQKRKEGSSFGTMMMRASAAESSISQKAQPSAKGTRLTRTDQPKKSQARLGLCSSTTAMAQSRSSSLMPVFERVCASTRLTMTAQ